MRPIPSHLFISKRTSFQIKRLKYRKTKKLKMMIFRQAVFIHRLLSYFSTHTSISLELLEGLLVTGSPGHLEGVEFDGFRERSAFTDSGNISNLDIPEKRHDNET